MPQTSAAPPPLPLMFTHADVIASGRSEAWLRSALRRGELVTVRRGVYCQQQVKQCLEAQAHTRHALQVVGAQRGIRCSWAAGWSAQVLWKLPVPEGEPRRVELAVPPGNGKSRSAHDLCVQLVDVPPAHRAAVLGVPVLSTARTVTDTARRHGLVAGLVAADAALRHQLIDQQELAVVLADCAGWPGINTARLVAKHASVRRESALESGSYALFVARGLPLPECNAWVVDDADDAYRGDFCWRRHRIVGEADGRVKHEDPWRHDNASPVLWREKLRAERIEDEGYVVTRWTGFEIEHHPDVVLARLRRASDRAVRLFDAPALIV